MLSSKPAPASSVPREGLRFGRIPPSIGTRWSVTVMANSTLDVFDGQATERQLSEYISAYAVEVREVEGPAPTRVRVVFAQNAQRYQGTLTPTPISGKTYDVGITPPYVQAASGVASPDEIERVLDVFPDLGTRTQVDQILPDATMKIGDERHELAEAMLRILHPRAWTLNKGTAVLATSDPEGATFTVTLDATSRGGVRIVVKGDVTIRIRDARLVSVTLEGTYQPTKPPSGGTSEPGTFHYRRVVRDL